MEDETTKNPYDFVPFPDGAAIERQPPSGHDTFSGISGRFECELEALSPLLVMGSEHRAGPTYHEVGRFQEDRRYRSLIPGSSLKGVVRSVFEVLVPSCVVSTNNEAFVPDHFSKCDTHDELCPTCRVFGALSRDRVHKGHVNFGEGVSVGEPSIAGEMQLVYLSNPDPRHRPGKPEQDYGTHSDPAGRKFYFHQHETSTAESDGDGPWVAPVEGRDEEAGESGTIFRFTVSFSNLSDKELSGLVAALVLSDAAPLEGVPEPVKVRHKVGYGKPAGLGSAEVRITRATVERDSEARYRSFRSSPDVFEQGTDAHEKWLAEQCVPFFRSPTSEIKELARILRYPPDPGVTYEYPEWQG
jgi:hypothetical protein